MQLVHPIAALDALIDSLQFDPFYAAITQELLDATSRRKALARYFDYSMTEAANSGRLVLSPDPSVGAAIWLLPLDPALSEAQSKAKAAFLAEAIGTDGAETYHRIVAFMMNRALASVDRSAWYLSIVGVAPSAQGQGVGARLLEPTLAEADAAGVPCYLETFDSRNPRFYRRLGFSDVATHLEPTTQASYTIMVRSPKR